MPLPFVSKWAKRSETKAAEKPEAVASADSSKTETKALSTCGAVREVGTAPPRARRSISRLCSTRITLSFGGNTPVRKTLVRIAGKTLNL